MNDDEMMSTLDADLERLRIATAALARELEALLVVSESLVTATREILDEWENAENDDAAR